MKKWIALVFSCLFLVSGLAFADHCKDRGECDKAHAKMIDKKVEKLTKKLDLTAEQKTQVRAALEKKMAGAEVIQEEIHAKMKTVHGEFRTTMDGILNEGQKKKYEKIVEKYHKDDCKECDDKGECPHS